MTAHRCGVLLVVLAVGLAVTACSTPPVHVSVPAGWKPVSYSGLTIDVPGSWPVYQRSKYPCGAQGPAVLVGPPPRAGYNCPAFIPPGPTITFGGPDIVMPFHQETREVVNGIETVVSTTGHLPGFAHGATTGEVVRFPGRHVWLKADVPGRRSTGVLGVIDQVVRTVKPST